MYWTTWLRRVEHLQQVSPRTAARIVRRRFRGKICRVAPRLSPNQLHEPMGIYIFVMLRRMTLPPSTSHISRVCSVVCSDCRLPVRGSPPMLITPRVLSRCLTYT